MATTIANPAKQLGLAIVHFFGSIFYVAFTMELWRTERIMAIIFGLVVPAELIQLCIYASQFLKHRHHYPGHVPGADLLN